MDEMKPTAVKQRSVVFGTEFAVKFFAKRGNHSEAHLKGAEVAAIAAFGYEIGASKEGSEALRRQLEQVRGALEAIIDCYGVGYRNPDKCFSDMADFILEARAALTEVKP